MDFKCSITHELAAEPVYAEDGELYDLEMIDRWVAAHGTSPKTRAPVARRYVRPVQLMDAYRAHLQALGLPVPSLAIGTVDRTAAVAVAAQVEAPPGAVAAGISEYMMVVSYPTGLGCYLITKRPEVLYATCIGGSGDINQGRMFIPAWQVSGRFGTWVDIKMGHRDIVRMELGVIYSHGPRGMSCEFVLPECCPGHPYRLVNTAPSIVGGTVNTITAT